MPLGHTFTHHECGGFHTAGISHPEGIFHTSQRYFTRSEGALNGNLKPEVYFVRGKNCHGFQGVPWQFDLYYICMSLIDGDLGSQVGMGFVRRGRAGGYKK